MPLRQTRSVRLSTALLATVAIAAACSDGLSPGTAEGIAIAAGANAQVAVGAQAENVIVAAVTDSKGLGVPGVTVTWTLVRGDGSINNTGSKTNAGGFVTTTYTSGTVADTVIVRADSPGLPSASAIFTQIAGSPAALTIVSGNNQSAGVSTTLANPLVVRLADAFGNAIKGATVTWTFSDNGQVSDSEIQTDANGRASVTYIVGTAPGPRTVVAKSGSLQATFTITGT